MSEGTMSGAAALSPPGAGPSIPGAGAGVNRGGPYSAADSQTTGAHEFHRVLENHLPAKERLEDTGKSSEKKHKTPGEAGPGSGHSRIDPGSTPAVLPGLAGTASGASSPTAKKAGQTHLSPASLMGPAGQGEGGPSSSASTSTASAGHARGGGMAGIQTASLGTQSGLQSSGTAQMAVSGAKGRTLGSGAGAKKEAGLPAANVAVRGSESGLMQGMNGQGSDAASATLGVKAPIVPPGTAGQGDRATATKKATDSGKAAYSPGTGAVEHAVVGVEASGRGVQQDPPTVKALAARKGFVEGLSEGSSSPGSTKVSPDGRSHRLAPSDSGAESSVGDGAQIQGLPGSLVLGQDQGMQGPSSVLTNVPSERVADALGENLASRPWRPGETATLRVTVVPADLGPVQVIAHMDAEGRLHVQIHAASPETQAIIQQQSVQLIHHLQQNHIPVQRLDVTPSPMTTGATGPGAGFTGGAGSGQGQPNPGFQSPASTPGQGGAGVFNEERDGLGEAASAARHAIRSPGTHAFEATV